MFPPASPLTERVRIELDNQQIEHEAIERARFSGNSRILSRIQAMITAMRPQPARSLVSHLSPLRERPVAQCEG